MALADLSGSADSVFFPKKDDSPAFVRSEIVFLDDQGLGVVVTDSVSDFHAGKYRGQPIELVAHDEISRLSLIRVSLTPGEKSTPVELGSSLELLEGASLFTAHEGELSASRLVSRESSYRDKPLPLELIRLHSPSEEKPISGDAFYDSAGRLVAICYRPALEHGNGCLAFPVEVVKRLTQSTVVDGIVQRSWFGVELLSSDPFAVVEGVRQDSPAAKAGLLKGDIILDIGPRKIRNYSDAIDAFYYLRENEASQVRLLRGVEELTLEVMPELVPLPKDVPTEVVPPPKAEEPEVQPTPPSALPEEGSIQTAEKEAAPSE